MPAGPPIAPYWYEEIDSCKPYGPPILHRDFPKGQPASGAGQKVKAFFTSFSLFSGNTSTIDNSPGEIVELYLKNTPPAGAHPAQPYRSQSFDNKTADYNSLEIVDEYFRLPLKKEANGDVTTEPWLTNTRVVFSVKTACPPDKLRLNINGRGAGGIKMRLGKPNYQVNQFGVHPQNAQWQQLEEDLSNLIDQSESLKVLTHENSPLRLQLSYVEENEIISCAWTYFHIPGQMEVRALEELGHQKLVMFKSKGNDLAPFGSTRALQEEDKNELNPRDSEVKHFDSVLIATGIPEKMKTINYREASIAGPEHEHFNLVIDEWNKEKGMASESDRLAQAHNEDFDPNSAKSRKYEGQPTTDNPRFADWLRGKQESNQSLLAQDKAALRKLETKTQDAYVPDDPAELQRINNHFKTTIGVSQFDKNKCSVLFQRKNRPRTYFGVMSWGGIFVLRRQGTDWYPEKLFHCGTQTVLIESGPDRFNPIDPAGNGNFSQQIPADVYHGKAAGAQQNWLTYDLPQPPNHFSLEYMITYGVTSCASMVFFPYVDDPDVMIFTHLMGNSSVAFERAFKHVMDPQAPLGACPHTEWRGVGSSLPEASEIRRYQRAQIFPANGPLVQPINYDSVMCPRESNLWGDVEASMGHNGLGIAFPASGRTVGNKPSFIGSFDHELAPGAGVGHPLNRKYQNDDGEAFKLMHDYVNGAFGTHDHRRAMYAQGAGRAVKQDGRTLSDFRDLVRGHADASITPTVLREAKPQDAMFRLHQVGKILFDNMERGAKELKDTPCTLFFQKAETELHNR